MNYQPWTTVAFWLILAESAQFASYIDNPDTFIQILTISYENK